MRCLQQRFQDQRNKLLEANKNSSGRVISTPPEAMQALQNMRDLVRRKQEIANSMGATPDSASPSTPSTASTSQQTAQSASSGTPSDIK